MTDKSALVIGLGASGEAAARLLRRQGANVLAVDSARSEDLEVKAHALRGIGVEVELRASELPARGFDLAVLSPGVPLSSPLVQQVEERGVPLIGELELGYQHSRCLHVAVTGTNGKTTTTELVRHLLACSGRKTLAAGNIGLPATAAAEESRFLDFLVVEASSFQLETIRYFRPVVAVLLNCTPDHLDRHGSMQEYLRVKARIFMNQNPFDWAIVQSEVMKTMRASGMKIPSKLITFSASDSTADIWLERGLLLSRLNNWAGPLLDLEQTRLRGPHNAENLMAALAVGHVLRIPLDQMAGAIKTYSPGPHRCQWIEEVRGVQFINDSKATNLDAMMKAIHSMPQGKNGKPNVWLIAGGKDKNLQYHDAGPLLARRVKQLFLLGECRDKLRAAWSLFTPCTHADSLEEAVFQAAGKALPGDVVLLSPACSSFDMFRNYQHRGEVFRQAVDSWRHHTGPPAAETPLSSPAGAATLNRISSSGADGAPRSSTHEPLTEKLNQRPFHE